jgi:hypothetical protein
MAQGIERYGCSPGAGESWLNKRLWMYNKNVREEFSGIFHLSLVMDGSSVDGKNYAFSVAYSWERGTGLSLWLWSFPINVSNIAYAANSLFFVCLCVCLCV